MDKINCIQHRIVNCGVKVVTSIPKAFGIILLLGAIDPSLFNSLLIFTRPYLNTISRLSIVPADEGRFFFALVFAVL